jgi:hypothetical protein
MGRTKSAPAAPDGDPKEPADGETAGETITREDIAAEPFVEPEVDQSAQVELLDTVSMLRQTTTCKFNFAVENSLWIFYDLPAIHKEFF